MATVTGLTAERMQEIIDKQINAGALDLSGHLIFTREDGSTFDAGSVKGAKGDDAVYAFPNYSAGSDIRYVRIGVLDGLNASNGAAMQFLLSGLGNFGTARRGTVLVHVAQRGVGGINLTAWSWGLDAAAAGSITLYTRQMGDFLFEVWAKLGAYIPKATLLLLSSWNSTLTLDSQTTVAPGSLVAATISRSDSPDASETLRGMIEIANNAETQTGTDSVRAVSPAGLASVVGIGTGYRFVQRVIFTSSGTFTKASYAGLRAIRVIAIGGGGSGAGAAGASTGMNSYGTGGGSGAYAESFITNIAGLATSVAVTVGAGGSATSAGALAGNDGSASSFGTDVVAGGGGGGNPKGNSAIGGYVRGGVGGVATAGDIQQGGTPGAKGMGRDTLAQGGDGAPSVLGGGGLSGAGGGGSGSYPGYEGTAYGAGGGGASVNAGGAANVSGKGANGVVIVEIYR